MSARIKAFLIHLIGSLILASCAVGLVFLVWYPAPFAQALGVTNIFLLILSIDVIVGPIFTLLVYKTGKKSLKFDLTTIIVLQLAVFSYGLHTVAMGRPAWLVFSVDQFYLVRAVDINQSKAQKADSEYRHAPWFGPKWVTTQLPDNLLQRKLIVAETLNSGGSLFASPNLYKPIANDREKIRSKAQPLELLKDYNNKDIVKAELAKWPSAIAWLPLWSDPQSLSILLDKNGEIVSIVNLKPWIPKNNLK